MLRDWTLLSENVQLMLSRQALQRAAETTADQAELLADEIEGGRLPDCGGPEALRLLAAVMRVTNQSQAVPAGHG
jgi:hypothetical protein